MNAYSRTVKRFPMSNCKLGPLAAVLSWVDERFGPIQSIGGSKFKPPNPPWWVYHCQLARPIGEFFTNYDVTALGSSVDPSLALMRALGEAVERYNSLNSLKFANTIFEEIAAEHPLYDKFPRCAEFEDCLPDLKQLPTEKLTQVKVLYLLDGTEVWVPAAFVHLNFVRQTGEPLVARSITTGTAFHADLFRAIWSGLLECAERDAMMLTWWNRVPAPRICISKKSVLADRIGILTMTGLQAYLFDISSDFNLPTVFCLLKAEQFPYWSVGASCHESPLEACFKAIDEAVMIRCFQNEASLNWKVPSFESFEWVTTLQDHSQLYLHWKSPPGLDFLLKSGNEISESEFMGKSRWKAAIDLDSLKDFAGKMREVGMTALYCELTIDDVRELGHCVKVIVPEMMPLSVKHSESFLATPRLAKAAGRPSLNQSNLNPYPHPFA